MHQTWGHAQQTGHASFISSAHGTFVKVDLVVGHEANHNKIQRIYTL